MSTWLYRSCRRPSEAGYITEPAFFDGGRKRGTEGRGEPASRLHQLEKRPTKPEKKRTQSTLGPPAARHFFSPICSEVGSSDSSTSFRNLPNAHEGDPLHLLVSTLHRHCSYLALGRSTGIMMTQAVSQGMQQRSVVFQKQQSALRSLPPKRWTLTVDSQLARPVNSSASLTCSRAATHFVSASRLDSVSPFRRRERASRAPTQRQIHNRAASGAATLAERVVGKAADSQMCCRRAKERCWFGPKFEARQACFRAFASCSSSTAKQNAVQASLPRSFLIINIISIDISLSAPLLQIKRFTSTLQHRFCSQAPSSSLTLASLHRPASSASSSTASAFLLHTHPCYPSKPILSEQGPPRRAYTASARATSSP